MVIIIIPFVFWGMGSSIRGGNKNTRVFNRIKKNTQHKNLVNFIKKSFTKSKKLDANDQIEKILSNFIGEKLISEKEKF